MCMQLCNFVEGGVGEAFLRRYLIRNLKEVRE